MARSFDPILVEVMKHELAAVTEEMAIAVSKTGRSAMVKIGDFAAAICDGQGRLIGPGYAAPFQLAIFMEVMDCVRAKWHGRLKPGDILLVNDPYAGMGHMPDVAIVAPIFWRGDILAYTIAYSHHTDIGGRFAGGFSSQCTETFEEGLRLPIVKLYAEGQRNEGLLDTILANVRTPEEWLGDAEAKIAGCWRGEQEIVRMLEKYGVETFSASCDYLMDYAERETRAAIRAIPDGVYEYCDFFEDDGFGTEGVELRLNVALRVSGDRLTADFSGTAPQARGAINLPLSMTKAMVYAAIKVIVQPDVLLNVGFTRPINIRVPDGCLVNPSYPAAVGGRAPLSFSLFDLVFRALAKALPDRVPIAGEGGDILHFAGTKADGTPFAMLDGFFGGWGGRPMKDGIDGGDAHDLWLVRHHAGRAARTRVPAGGRGLWLSGRYGWGRQIPRLAVGLPPVAFSPAGQDHDPHQPAEPALRGAERRPARRAVAEHLERPRREQPATAPDPSAYGSQGRRPTPPSGQRLGRPWRSLDP